jgi:DoxX-like family
MSTNAIPTSSTTFGVSRVTIGRVLSALAVLFLAFDTVIKFTGIPAVEENMTQLGYAMSSVVVIAILELVCLVAYLVPRTSVLGAVILTGYLGGAIASHLRVGNPLFSHVLFPTYIAALLWGGLYLRDTRVRAIISAR